MGPAQGAAGGRFFELHHGVNNFAADLVAELRADLQGTHGNARGKHRELPRGRTPADLVSVDRVVDTTGAGDAFAAGFLAGYTQGNDVTVAARMGNIAAAEVISHMGARPNLDLKSLVAERLTAG